MVGDGAAEGSPEISSAETAPTQQASRKSGPVNWGTATLVGVFAGLLYGGSKEAAASVSKDAEVMLKLGSTPDKREQYRLMRDAMEKRFVRVTRGSIVGGVRLGMFTAVFCGLQNVLADQRGVHDVFNIAAAGSATAATCGLILPGSIRWRARNVLLGSVLGAGICFPLGGLPPHSRRTPVVTASSPVIFKTTIYSVILPDDPTLRWLSRINLLVTIEAGGDGK